MYEQYNTLIPTGKDEVILKKKLIFKISGIIALSILGGVASGENGVTIAKASSVPTENVQSQHEDLNYEQTSSLESLDQFVSVENNQFKLSVPNSYKASPTVVQEAQRVIDETNTQVQKDNGFIDPNTKEVSYGMSLNLRAAKRKAYEARHYWWGTRHIYRSNKAVENYCHTLENRAGTLQGLSILGIANPAGALASATSWYFNNVTSNLRHENAIHPKNKLVMDVNYDLKYTIKVWHD